MTNEIIEVFPSWFLISETISIYILLIFSIITLPLYFFEIYIVWQYRKTIFQGPFYRLMFVGMVVDVVTLINIFTGQILPAKQIFSQFYLEHASLMGTLFYTITYGGRCVQGATAMLLAFNRVCAVCFPILYRKLNTARYTRIMQFFQLIGGVFAVVLLLGRDYKYKYENDGYYSSFDDLEFRKKFYILVAILEVFFMTCIVFFNISMIFALKFKYKTTSETRRSSSLVLNQRVMKEKQKREYSLTQMTFIVCTLEIVYFIFIVYTLQVNTTINKKIFYFFYNLLGVIYSTYSAWMLLVFSRPITMQFATFLSKFSRVQKTQTGPTSSNNASREHRPSTIALTTTRNSPV